MRNLLSLFHPLAASVTAAAPPHPLTKVGQSFANVDMPKITSAWAIEDRVKMLSCPQAKVGSSLANVPSPNTIPALYMEHHVKYSSMPTSAEDPYMTRMQHVHPPPIVESQRVHELQSAQHGWLRTTNFVESALTVAEHKQLTAPSHAYSHQPHVTQGISTDIRNPYLRFRVLCFHSFLYSVRIYFSLQFWKLRGGSGRREVFNCLLNIKIVILPAVSSWVYICNSATMFFLSSNYLFVFDIFLALVKETF